ncbi:hypothetical protein ACIQOW_10040 [Kitasatospora sp. NPDC091335]
MADGHHTLPGVTEDGCAATIAVTASITPSPQDFPHVQALFDATLCAK